jgi:uncharacterized membrane protein YfcA
MTLALAALIGLSLALLGAGGSIVTMPLLIYGAGLDAHRAAGTSLLVVGLVAALGALGRWPSVRVRAGVVFGAAGMLGALPGAWLNHRVPAEAVVLGFAATTFVAAALLLRPGRTPRRRFDVHGGRAIAAGAVLGVATGFFGVGGGFLIVPALTLLLGLDVRSAVATSLLVITLNSTAGLAAHGRYGAVEWRLGLEVAAMAGAGALAALPLARRLTGPVLQRSFAGALVVIGAIMLWQGLRALA